MELRARMGVRGLEPNHKRVLYSTMSTAGFPDPSHRLSRHTLLRPTRPLTTSGPAGLRPGYDRSSVVFLFTSSAHTIRSILFASATVTSMRGLRASSEAFLG